MLSWQYNEKIMKDLIYNHARDYGRFCAQLMLDFPLIYKDFIKGFDDELTRRTRGDDPSPTDKDGVSGG
jgi:hypothetical protein